MLKIIYHSYVLLLNIFLLKYVVLMFPNNKRFQIINLTHIVWKSTDFYPCQEIFSMIFRSLLTSMYGPTAGETYI